MNPCYIIVNGERKIILLIYLLDYKRIQDSLLLSRSSCLWMNEWYTSKYFLDTRI